MKILSLVIAVAVVVCLVPSAMAQTAETPDPVPANAGAAAAAPSDQGGQSANPRSSEGDGKLPVAAPPETEAQKAARVEKIRVLQAQVDNCNLEFMGLPKEHEECIQKVRDQITGDSGGPEEESNE